MGVLASIVVNNFNYARFLGAAIDSALTQTYAPLEVVVVDDGSTDTSMSVIASYGERIKAVPKANGGMASALNEGFRACAGEVVIFLDSDDVLFPTAAANAVALLRDAGVAKVHWPLREVDADNRETGRLVPLRDLPEGDVRDLLIARGPMGAPGAPTSGNAWSRRFLERVLPMPERSLRQHADSYLNTLAGLYGSLAKISEPQGAYRVHGGNDYASQPRADRLRRNLHMYHYRCRVLSAHLRGSGIEVHPAVWKTGIRYYHRIERETAVLRQIEDVVPAGERFILVDDGGFGPGNMIAGRQHVRFPSDSGDARGLPVRDTAAIQALERLHADGAGFIAFVATALAWLRELQEFRHHLDTCHSLELETDLLVVFRLGA